MKNILYSKFANKQVVDCKNGRILGYTVDLKFDGECGEICSFFVRENGKLCFKPKSHTVEIPWDKITKIGDDIIIVDVDFYHTKPDKKQKKRADNPLF